MEIMSNVICPYCKEWLDIENLLTMDDLKNDYTYKRCSRCNKNFALYLETNIRAKPSDIETEIRDRKRTIKFLNDMNKRNPTLQISYSNTSKDLDLLYQLEKENKEVCKCQNRCRMKSWT